MCGRYYVNEEAWSKLREQFPELSRTGPTQAAGQPKGSVHAGMQDTPWMSDGKNSGDIMPAMQAARGDITPAMQAAAIVAGTGHAGIGSGVRGTREQERGASKTSAHALALVPLTWGFIGYDGKSLIINARAESILTKPTFAESIRERRCVLPAAGFYEWDRERQKVTFTDPAEPVIYLAGIYRPYGDDMRFAVITREANESMRPVHDRMPLMIAPEQVRTWIRDPAAAQEMLREPMPQLQAKRDYEQLSLF